MRNDAGVQGELNRRGVDDTDDGARFGIRKDTEKGSIAAILCVYLNDLLVVVRTLQKLDARVHRSAICFEKQLETADGRIERPGAHRTTLNCRARVEALWVGFFNFLIGEGRLKREFRVADIFDSDRVGTSWRFNNCGEWADLAVLTVDAHLRRTVIWA